MASYIERRKFLATLLGGAAAAWPLATRAQQPDGMRRIGVLLALAEDDPETKVRLAAFWQGLEKRGWSEGRNVRIDYRFAPVSAQAEVLAKELVALQPDVILANSTPVTAALQRESRTIPIVFLNVSDPIGSGFVASLPRPGGNLTGVMLYEASVTGKWLAMLKEIAPNLVRAAFVGHIIVRNGCDAGQRGAMMFAIQQAMRRIEWRIEAANDSAEAEQEAEFADSLRGDMSHTWDSFLIEVLSMLGFGYSAHEIVYKRRLGEKPKGRPNGQGDIPSSKYDDGRIGWRRHQSRRYSPSPSAGRSCAIGAQHAWDELALA